MDFWVFEDFYRGTNMSYRDASLIYEADNETAQKLLEIRKRMAKKENEKHTELGLSILQGIKEARAYARGEANEVRANTFHIPRTDVKKFDCA